MLLQFSRNGFLVTDVIKDMVEPYSDAFGAYWSNLIANVQLQGLELYFL